MRKILKSLNFNNSVLILVLSIIFLAFLVILISLNNNPGNFLNSEGIKTLSDGTQIVVFDGKAIVILDDLKQLNEEEIRKKIFIETGVSDIILQPSSEALRKKIIENNNDQIDPLNPYQYSSEEGREGPPLQL